MVKSADQISGKYLHYKGREYEVYCTASDTEGNQYVLYQQCYGDQSFWIRPYDMFFESIEVDGNLVRRFSPVCAEKLVSSDAYIQKLIALNDGKSLRIRHTETEEEVVIHKIDDVDRRVTLC